MWLVGLVHWIFGSLVGGLFWPLRNHPLLGLLIVSAVTGVAALWVFGKISNQALLKTVRNRIQGNLLGIRIYQHDVKTVLRLQNTILRNIVTYLRLVLVPFLLLLLPILLLLVQLDYRLSRHPLKPGQQALVKASLDESPLERSYAIKAGPGIEVETEALRIPQLGELVWRIKAIQSGSSWVQIESGNEALLKEVVIGEAGHPISAVRSSRISERLLHPGEDPLDPRQPISSVSLGYPEASIDFFGFKVHWLWIFTVVSIGVGFACKGLIGVQI